MAKRKSKMKVGGMLTEAAGLTIGAAAAAKVSGIALPIVPEKLRPALPIVIGFLLMNRGGGLMKSVGAGMIAGGGVKLLGQLAPGLGIGAGEGISEYQIEGAEDYALAGDDNVMLPSNETVTGLNSSYALAGMDEANSDFAG